MEREELLKLMPCGLAKAILPMAIGPMFRAGRWNAGV